VAASLALLALGVWGMGRSSTSSARDQAADLARQGEEGEASTRTETKLDYHVVHCRRDGMNWWAVSALNRVS
jgi:hypothetical protein